MRKIRVPITNFQYGEVSSYAIARTDSGLYTSSAQTVQNMLVRSEGGVVRRPGLENIYDYSLTRDTSKTMQSKLVHFIFSDDERYIVSIEHAKVRVFYLDTSSISLAATITQDTDTNALPFDDDYIHEYTHSQYGDVMFICHPLFMPRMLVRTGLTSFEITPYSFDSNSDGSKIYQPYSNFHAADVTLNPSATTGSGVTLTTNADYFDTTGSQTGGNYLSSLHVGVILQYGTEGAEIEIDSVQSATQATGTVISNLTTRLSILNPLRTREGSTSVEVTHIGHGLSSGASVTISNASSVGGIAAASINGNKTISSVIDENTYVITAGASATSSEDGGGYVSVASHAPVRTWYEQSFSAKRGYPAAVTFHENRLIFGGTIAEPDTLWLSKSGSYFNFDYGDAADSDAFDIVGSTGDVNEIRYIVSNRDLQVFTASAELYVPSFLNQSITPTNAQIRRQTPYGSIFVEPKPIDGATLFVQAGGNVVREYIYTDQENAYSSPSVSSLSSHLVNGPIDSAVCSGAFSLSESYCLFVDPSGTISCFNSNRAEKRAAWSKITCNGAFSSVVSIDDRLFANVWWDSSTLRLCEFNVDYTLDNAKLYTLSSGIATVSSEYDNDDVVHVVGVTAGGVKTYLGTFTVSSGQVDLSGEAVSYTQAYVGISYIASLVTNPIDFSFQYGPMTGDPRGVCSAIVDFRNTTAATVNGRPFSSSTAFNGKSEIRTTGFGRDPQITITQSEPTNLEVIDVTAEVVF